jgi:hypothetical protein
MPGTIFVAKETNICWVGTDQVAVYASLRLPAQNLRASGKDYHDSHTCIGHPGREAQEIGRFATLREANDQ